MPVLSSCIASITRILIPNRNPGSQRIVSTGAIVDVVMVSFVKATRSALLYSCLQNHWRELPRSGCPTIFWLERPAMGGQIDFSNVDVESIKYEAVYSSFGSSVDPNGERSLLAKLLTWSSHD